MPDRGPNTRVGILGGTLDPIHVGHIETAIAARDALALDDPGDAVAGSAASHAGSRGVDVPPLRDGGAGRPELDGPGWCATTSCAGTDRRTRHAARAAVAARTLAPLQMFFITGADAFAEIETWHRYPQVLDLAHFVVISRPGMPAATLRSSGCRRSSARLQPAGVMQPSVAGRRFFRWRRARRTYRRQISAGGCAPASASPASCRRRSRPTSCGTVCTSNPRRRT